MYKLDLQSILKSVASKTVLWETPHIKRAFTFQNSEGKTILKTDGINVIVSLLNMNGRISFIRFYNTFKTCLFN